MSTEQEDSRGVYTALRDITQMSETGESLWHRFQQEHDATADTPLVDKLSEDVVKRLDTRFADLLEDMRSLVKEARKQAVENGVKL